MIRQKEYSEEHYELWQFMTFIYMKDIIFTRQTISTVRLVDYGQCFIVIFLLNQIILNVIILYFRLSAFVQI